MSPRHAGVAAVLLLTVIGCGGKTEEPVPTLVASRADFEVVVRAHGELAAARSTVIKIPPQLSTWQTIGWIAEEGALVRAGDPVLVFSDVDIVAGTAETESKIGLEDLRRESAENGFDRDDLHLHNQLEVLDMQRDMATRYAPKDEQIFSRNQIIEATIDLEVLGTESAYLNRQGEQLGLRQVAELELLTLQRRTHEVKLSQLQSARANLALTAPHDGVFLLGEGWSKESLRPGTRVHPMWNLGELPDLSQMTAKVWVHESEAGGLKAGLAATVSLDIAPGRAFKASVARVSGVAAPIDEASPARYFEVTLDLAELDRVLLRPRHRVEAAIFVERLADVIAVPNQAVFEEGGTAFVMVREGGRFLRRDVVLGSRGPSRTVVRTGLAAGDELALARPPE